jgi:hypothetical protein
LNGTGQSILFEDQLLFGTYFFLSDVRREETRTVFNVIKMLSEFGGIYVSVLGVIGGLAKLINTQVFMSYMIKEL